MNALKFRTLIVAFLIGFSSLMSASNDKQADKKEVMISITKDVQKLIKNNNLTLSVTELATVKIMINSKNEIVVLSLDIKSTVVDAFVKRRLNYKKVSTKTESKLFA
jgi:hypothetical protein